MIARLLTGALVAVTTVSAAHGGDWGWDDEVPATQDPVVQFGPSVSVAPDGTVYAVWLDNTDYENGQINLLSSGDAGQTWSDSSVIISGAAYENLKMVAAESGIHVLHVEFEEDEENEYKLLYHSVSTDGGTTFSPAVQIGKRENIEFLRFQAEGGVLLIHAMNIVFAEAGDLFQPFLYVSEDGGQTWEEKLMPGGESMGHPSFAHDGGLLHLVNSGQGEIKYRTSGDLGTTWSATVDVSSGAGPHSQLPRIAVDGGAINVAWEDDRTGQYEIVRARSDDGGASFGADVQANATLYGARVRLQHAAGRLHMFWCQYHGDDGWPGSWGSGDFGVIWSRSSDDAGATWSDEFRVSQNDRIDPMDLPVMGAGNVKVAADDAGNVYAMFQDKRDGNVDLYFRRTWLDLVTCDGDIDGDEQVAVNDLVLLILAWGPCADCDDCPADLNGDCIVDVTDLVELILAWGECD